MLGSSPDLAPGAAGLGHCSCSLWCWRQGWSRRGQGKDEVAAQCLLLLSLHPRGILNWVKAEMSPLPLYGGGGVPCQLLTALAFPLRKA